MDIKTIDLEFQGTPQAIAAYLVQTSEGPILIETGPESARPILVTKLAAMGIAPTDINHVLVTHIHFDHAGAAGWWASQGAHIYIHHIGAPHLINPDRLIASASRIYGDQMETLWGQIIPIPAEQVTAVHDNDVLQFGDVTVTAWDTPGHAWHHHTYVIDNIAFTGDVGAVRVPGTNWISLPAPPPEFKLEVWLDSLERVQSADFTRIYPTHFGPFDDVTNHWELVRESLIASVEFIANAMQQGADRDTILARYSKWNRERASARAISDDVYTVFETANPLYMSVDGIMRYWRKKWERE
ncbi:MAG: MBL fold metallo-hydrolase [Anaerolineae bacterium]|nr:MBL fold metallo-hydrolase [Anaerolineae bacterium]